MDQIQICYHCLHLLEEPSLFLETPSAEGLQKNSTLSSASLSKPVFNLLPVMMAQKHQWGSAELKVDANQAF